MGIISEENPEWAEALTQKALSFDKIISWKAEVILDIVASVNMLSFSTALKSLTPEQLESFLQKLSHQDRRRMETSMQETNPSPNEISASVIKVISETRGLLVQGVLKADRVDPQLVIPDDFESSLDRSKSTAKHEAVVLSFDGPPNPNVVGANASVEIDKLQKRLVLLSKEVQSLRSENQVMKDKLEKIKKIA